MPRSEGLVRLVVALDAQRRVLVLSRCSAVASLSSSAWVRADRRSPSTGGGLVGWAAPRRACPSGASVSPVAVSASLATAAMSPAGDLDAGSCSLPRIGDRPCSRSSAPDRGFTRWSSALERARQHLEQRELADVRVGDRLEHERSGSARVGRDLDLGVAGGHRDRGAVEGRRADLADEVGEPVDADCSVAEPHTHGNTVAVGDARGRACARARSKDRHLAVEVALHAGRRRRRRCPRRGCRAPGAPAPAISSGIAPRAVARRRRR